MNKILALCILHGLAGCDTTPSQPASSEQIAGKGTRAPVAAPTGGPERVANATANGPHKLRFWIKEGVEPQSDDEGHPCGGVRELSISTIPDFPKAGPLEAANASEHASSGAAINSWNLPVDFVPVAIDGTNLLIEVPGAIDQPWEQYWISTDGTILRPKSRVQSAASPLTCPEDLKEYDLSCYPLKDPGTLATRLIAAENVCT